MQAGSAIRKFEMAFASSTLKSIRRTQEGKNPSIFVQSKFSLFASVSKHCHTGFKRDSKESSSLHSCSPAHFPLVVGAGVALVI